MGPLHREHMCFACGSGASPSTTLFSAEAVPHGNGNSGRCNMVLSEANIAEATYMRIGLASKSCLEGTSRVGWAKKMGLPTGDFSCTVCGGAWLHDFCLRQGAAVASGIGKRETHVGLAFVFTRTAEGSPEPRCFSACVSRGRSGVAGEESHAGLAFGFARAGTGTREQVCRRRKGSGREGLRRPFHEHRQAAFLAAATEVGGCGGG